MLEFAKELDVRTRNIVGLIARSHGVDKYNFLFDPGKKRTSMTLKQKVEVIFRKEGWVGFNLDHGPGSSSLISDSFLKEYGNNINFIREYVVECPFEGDPTLDNLLERYIGDDVLIPFAMQERKKKFPFAFKELKPYMEKYKKR